MRYALQAKKRSAFARGSKKKRGPAVTQPNPKKTLIWKGQINVAAFFVNSIIGIQYPVLNQQSS
jgi:hypothetical protein